MKDVLIIGGGIGGLTLALFLHKAGIPCRVYESVREVKPLGVGINLLPYATAELAKLDVFEKIQALAVETKESVYGNRFGQVVLRRPTGVSAGYSSPQLSIHRGELQCLLLDAVKEKIGADRVHSGWRCTEMTQDDNQVTAKFVSARGERYPDQQGSVLIGCDGIHSKVRALLYPNDAAPLYQGINMWRGTSEWKPFLSGASMLRIGLPKLGKLVIYPIKNNIDGQGTQLINWVVEIEGAQHAGQDWNKVGQLSDFIEYFSDWNFNWLDVPGLLKAHNAPILQYPMMDKDPLSQWSFGRVSLLGDAAHPMVPLGSNGAGQAILDADELTRCLSTFTNTALALKRYEENRLNQTAKITEIDRSRMQDRLLNEIYLRTHDRPFSSIDQVFSHNELTALSEPTYQLVER